MLQHIILNKLCASEELLYISLHQLRFNPNLKANTRGVIHMTLGNFKYKNFSHMIAKYVDFAMFL